jgi:NMD protein affecting ribosome stability and mRNA decay
VSARVTHVDVATRVVDFEMGDGRFFSAVAGSEVRNLEQLKPGDVVNVAYIESLVLQLRKRGGAAVTRTETQDSRRAPLGATPGAVEQKQESIVADVVAVNASTGEVTLRGPERTVTLRIRDPRQLALIEAGDQVEATFTDAVAVAVDPAR